MHNMLRKILAMSLCAAMIGGTAAVLPVFVCDSGIVAKAAETYTYGSFKYTISNAEVTITGYTGSDKKINIPTSIDGKNVTGIGSYAFNGCTGLTSVTFPSSLTKIGSNAFKGCTGLTSITIPSGVSLIGASSFSGCTGLKSVTIQEGVESIGSSAFYGCTGITDIAIPDSIVSIQSSAFMRCEGLTSVTIPYGVTNIGVEAFALCTNLKSINVDSDNYKYVSKSGVLYTRRKNNLVCCPAGKTSITISDGVSSIEDYAFYGCAGLTSVIIPKSVTAIGKSAFSGCKGLTSLTISEGVTSIGEEAFLDCDGITSVVIPESTASIGKYALGYYWSMKEFGYLQYEGFTIYGKAGSAAESYAKDNSLNFSESIVNVTRVKLNKSALILEKGKSKTLSAYIMPAEATDKNLIWYSDNKSVASVNNGIITAAGKGTCTIYAKSINGIKGSCTVTVVPELNNTTTINSDIVQIGDKVRISASAKGGSGGYKYAYYYKRSTNGGWNTLGTEWGTDSSVAFAPTSEASYDIKVIVRDSNRSTSEKRFTVKALKELELTNVSVVGRQDIKLGTAIPMVAKAVGGAGGFRYSFYFKRSTNTTYRLLGDKYTTNASARFKPSAKGTYDIRIDVMDKSGKVVKKFFTATVN